MFLTPRGHVAGVQRARWDACMVSAPRVSLYARVGFAGTPLPNVTTTTCCKTTACRGFVPNAVALLPHRVALG